MAEGGGDLGPGAGAVTCFGRLRIDHRHEGRRWVVQGQQGGQGGDAVPRGAAAGAVGGLDEDDGPAADLQAGADRRLRREGRGFELAAVAPVVPGRLEGQAPGAVDVAVDDEEAAAAEIRLIEEGMHEEEAGRQHARPGFVAPQVPHHAGEGAVTVGGTVDAAHDDGHLGQGHRRPAASPGDAEEEAGAALSGAGGVAVRVGGPGHQAVGVLDHGAGHVGVQVEGGDHRDLGSDEGPHRGDQVPLDIVDAIGDGASVEGEQDPVDGQGPRETAEQLGAQIPVAVGGDAAAGAGAGRDQGSDGGAGGAQGLERSPDDAGLKAQDLVASAQLVAGEPVEVDRGAAELVALGQDRAEGDPHGRRNPSRIPLLWPTQKAM